ncbi:MAG TPA: FtsH protease activity modulator HflK [Usitatibacter sp.]|jgi:membrane protease subunit HflK|nr:FtsH protease activity modulator HflK [Usitatibacter sp.]
MPPNDPQWGKKDNEGPPDLDEILRKLQQKIAGLLGFRPRGPSTPTGGSHYGAAVGGGAALVILLVLAVWLASGFYIVDEGKRGVVLRFGKYLETTMPGARWHMPYPVESVEVVDVARVRPVEVGYRGNTKNKQPQEALMLTDDENIVDVQFAVQYNIKSPEDYLFNNKDPDDNVRQAAETAIREVVGKNKMDFVLSAGRSEVAAQVKTLMQQILDRYKTGILVTSVNLQNTQAPDPVLPAFEDVVRAQQDLQRFKNEGQAYANDVVPKARGVAARLMEEANGYRQSVIANAQGDAARFNQILTEYERAPAVTRERMYLEAMQHILSSTSKVVVDTKAAGGQSLLYLPIDKLMQRSGAPSSSATVSVPEGTTIRPGSSDNTSSSSSGGGSDLSRRDALRSRDRESR